MAEIKKKKKLPMEKAIPSSKERERRGLKRLRDELATQKGDNGAIAAVDADAEKKKKRRKQEKEKFKALIEGGWETIQNDPIEKQQSFFWLNLARALKDDLTALELTDEVQASAFCPPDSAEIHKRVLSAAPGLRAASKQNGTPLVLVVSRSTARCYDVARLLFKLGSTIRVGQLFSNKKVAEQEQMLRSSPCHVAVGTPERLRKLVESGALSLEKLSLIAIDVSKDLKGYHTLDLHDTALAFYRFYMSALHPLVKANSTKIMLFN